MENMIFQFKQSAEIFEDNGFIVETICKIDPRFNLRWTTSNPAAFAKTEKRRIIKSLLNKMVNARTIALQIPGYGRASQLAAITRLKDSLKVLDTINHEYSLYSYVFEVIIPDMWLLAPGSKSRFKNYPTELKHIEMFCISELRQLKKVVKNSTKL